MLLPLFTVLLTVLTAGPEQESTASQSSTTCTSPATPSQPSTATQHSAESLLGKSSDRLYSVPSTCVYMYMTDVPVSCLLGLGIV